MTTREMNELIHTPTRLRIMSALAELGVGSDISFTRLQALLDMTPGNLSAHVKRLEDAGYVAMERSFTPRGAARSHIAITPDGQAAFIEYVQQLRNIIGTPLAENGPSSPHTGANAPSRG